jgi:hypothetical protein
LAASIPVLHIFVLSRLSFSLETLKNVPDIILYIMQIYLLLLWTVPREVWNFLGGVIFVIQSVIVTIMPDLPTYFDDLGMIFAVFAFIFLYINTVAALIERILDKRIINRVRPIVESFVLKNSLIRQIAEDYSSFMNSHGFH